MNRFERASQLWPLLALAATNRQILTYSQVSRLTGIPRPALGGFLDPIAKFCEDRKIPPLTVLVVSKSSKIPGTGFTSAADIPKAQADVFAYDWLKFGCPKPEKIEMAWRKATKT